MSTGLFTHESCYRHLTGPMSPESPERITAIEERLVASGLEGAFKRTQTNRQACQEDLLRAHDQEYVDHVISLIPHTEGELVHISEDTVVSEKSLEAALESAGCVLEAVDQVADGRLTNAFCCVRPPGHHAHHAKAEGFCIFNNVAIAALYARDVLKLKRIAVLDIDAHHGDGTDLACIRREQDDAGQHEEGAAAAHHKVFDSSTSGRAVGFVGHQNEAGKGHHFPEAVAVDVCHAVRGDNAC